MLQKDITQYSIGYEIKTHPSIKGMQIIEDKNNFPISWLNKQVKFTSSLKMSLKKIQLQ